jgi:hypothetical protein
MFLPTPQPSVKMAWLAAITISNLSIGSFYNSERGFSGSELSTYLHEEILVIAIF